MDSCDTVRTEHLGQSAELDILSYDERVSNHEVSRFFVASDGILGPDLYSEDGIHLNPEGYKVWTKNINQKLRH